MGSSELAPYAEYVASLLRVSVDIRRIDETPRTGQSKLSGHPDLPSMAQWPMHASGPHEFIAQFNLAEVGKALGGLPTGGLLSFFAATSPTDDVFWLARRRLCSGPLHASRCNPATDGATSAVKGTERRAPAGLRLRADPGQRGTSRTNGQYPE